MKVKFKTFESIYSGQMTHVGGIFGVLQSLVPHGIGRCTSDDGNLFHEGQFRYGVMHGYGRGIFDWGGHYEGLWQDNMWHGQGKFFNEAGHVYEGQWASNVPHGQLSIIKTDETGSFT